MNKMTQPGSDGENSFDRHLGDISASIGDLNRSRSRQDQNKKTEMRQVDILGKADSEESLMSEARMKISNDHLLRTDKKAERLREDERMNEGNEPLSRLFHTLVKRLYARKRRARQRGVFLTPDQHA